MASSDLQSTPVLPKYRRVSKPYEYVYKGTRITVPKDFVYDGASIPRIFWGLLTSPFMSQIDNVSCVHDYLYRKDNGVDIDRRTADDIFFYMLRENDMSWLKSYILYTTLRGLGYFAWKKRSVSDSFDSESIGPDE